MYIHTHNPSVKKVETLKDCKLPAEDWILKKASQETMIASIPHLRFVNPEIWNSLKSFVNEYNC